MPVQDELYQNLYRAWKSELTGTDLRKINESSNFLLNIRQMYQNLSKVVSEEGKPLGRDLYKKLLYNIQFMLNDLLELRSEKILCATKQGKKIDESILLDLEIEYYRSLFTAYKGVNKYRSTIFLPDLLTENDPHSTITSRSSESPIQYPQKIENSPIPEQISSTISINDNNLEKKNPITVTNSEPKISISKEEIPKITAIPEINPEKSIEHQISTPSKVLPPKTLIRPSTYSTVRIIKTTPPLVGEDFEIYGPFKEEDIIYIPQRNAEILIEEKVAKAFLH